MTRQVSTDHRFENGQLIFTITCSRCDRAVELTNPWCNETCECGQVWRLKTVGVMVDRVTEEEEEG